MEPSSGRGCSCLSLGGRNYSVGTEVVRKSQGRPVRLLICIQDCPLKELPDEEVVLAWAEKVYSGEVEKNVARDLAREVAIVLDAQRGPALAVGVGTTTSDEVP